MSDELQLAFLMIVLKRAVYLKLLFNNVFDNVLVFIIIYYLAVQMLINANI